MSHLLKTVNPEAAADANSGEWKPAGAPLKEWTDLPEVTEPTVPAPESAPIPGIGHIVVFHLRTGDSRNRRAAFPAIVMASEPETGLLKLWVIVDDGDTWMQDQVPARVAPEPGWERVAPDSLVEVPSNLVENIIKTIDSIRSAETLERESVAEQFTLLTEQVANLNDRLAEVENHPALDVPPLPAAPAKRKPGRPAKTPQSKG